MSFSIEFADDSQSYNARIKVVGCGGAGGNAINTMVHFGLGGVEFCSVNTDAQALNGSAAAERITIGQNVTRGLGAGADPDVGRKSALEDINRLKEAIQGCDMVFITAGMGGGTGTGAAPVVAQLAREAGALTVAVVTKPFLFEGRQRARRAEQGLVALADHVDTLVTIPNEKLVGLADDDLTFLDAFRKADEVLYQAVKGITDLITLDGLINVDFADVRTVMSGMGRALMGTGAAKGEGRARIAAEHAITSPLLDDISVEGATGVLLNIVGGPDMKMREVQEAAAFVSEQAHEDANVIWGASVDESMADALKVTVIATGFDRHEEDADELLRQASRQPLERAQVRERRDSQRDVHAPRTVASRGSEEMAHAYAARRSGAATAASLQAGSQPPASSARIAIRDRITFPSHLDTDWDTPAFQRRAGG